MRTTIASDTIQVTVDSLGAELCSVLHEDGTEYMWRADPSIWGRHAPVLFPIVGALSGGVYAHEGQSYEMGQHGFARDSEFELIEQTNSALVYRLLPDDATRKIYPFEFELLVRYSLIEDALFVQYEVTNRGDATMPFSIGAHPGFSTELCDGDDLEDYYLEFSCAETADTHLLDDDHLLSAETRPVLSNSSKIPITRDMFNHDALVFFGLKSESLSIRSTKHDRFVTVDFPGFPHLGIWAKPAAPYVCIEPWHGHVDPADHDGVLSHKPGIIILEPGESSACAHTIRVG